ncbi:MAG TPA: hypothetical protein VK689_16075, partial [Armatimonadota bacterium]|nr:hypothetical protein [Armatimonadota bacterium]
PFARTFAPIVAGIAEMPYRTFMSFNVIGGITWVLICTLLGYFLGSIPLVRDHNEKVILLIIAISLLRPVIHVLKERMHNRKGGPPHDNTGGDHNSAGHERQTAVPEDESTDDEEQAVPPASRR